MMPRQRRWFNREWLGGIIIFISHARLRNRSFLNRKQGFSVIPVEYHDPSLFAQLHYRINWLTIFFDRNEDRGSWKIIIPHVVMRHLEVPFIFSGSCIQCNNRIGKKIRAFPVATMKIETG